MQSSGENLGFGEGHNRLLERVEAEVAIIANPDLTLDAGCVERLADCLAARPAAVIAGAALLTPQHTVNAYGLRLTRDLLGINTDRGRAHAELLAAGRCQGDAADRSYLGPSGALFAVNRRAWPGGPLFPRSFFLYGEDVALFVKVRRARGEIRFCPEAFAEHAWSTSTGVRSALKLYHVERNRLWLARALYGDVRAAALLGFTGLRYAAYLATSTRAERAAGAPLRSTLARAIGDGLFGRLPAEVAAYLACRDPAPLDPYFAPLAEQLRNPLAGPAPRRRAPAPRTRCT